jgi:hypothetical protein
VHPDLSEHERGRVVALVDEALRNFPCPAPLPGETEPQFTARVLVPKSRRCIEDLDIPGFTIAGEGVGRPIPTYLLGHRFYPDLSVSYFGHRLVAYEVKFLRRYGRSGSISTALGQCLLYQLDRYPRVRALLIESFRAVSPEDQDHCSTLFHQGQERIKVIYKRPVQFLGSHDELADP